MTSGSRWPTAHTGRASRQPPQKALALGCSGACTLQYCICSSLCGSAPRPSASCPANVPLDRRMGPPTSPPRVPDLHPQNRCEHGLIRRPGRPSSGWPLACSSDRTRPPRQWKPGESLSSQTPEDPKPPAPLSVGAISSTATRQTFGISMNTNCAMRSPGNTEKGASPKFASTIFTSPR